MRALRGRIPKAHDRLVAMAFASYGNSDGSRNYPGLATLAEELFISESTVKRSLAWLAENGWIARVERGDRWAKKADVWQLTLPAPVAAELGRWEPEQHGSLWMQRPAG
jgi:DNA-binding transcriptional MocR family regulator